MSVIQELRAARRAGHQVKPKPLPASKHAGKSSGCGKAATDDGRIKTAVVKQILEVCVPCSSYPCLTPKICGHENALRKGAACPEAKWTHDTKPDDPGLAAFKA